MSRKQLQDDIATALTAYPTFTDVDLGSDGLSFTVYHAGDEFRFMLQVDDYPEFSQLHVPGGDEPLAIIGRVKDAFKMAEEYAQKKTLSNSAWKGLSQGSNDDRDLGGSYGDDDLTRELADQDRWKENSQLVLDIENYRAIFNATVNVRPLMDSVGVELTIMPRECFDSHTARAWGVDFNLPIVLHLMFTSYYVDDLKAPQVQCYQLEGTTKHKFKLQWQLAAISQKFLNEVWPATTGKKIVSRDYRAQQKSPAASATSSSDTKGGKGLLSVFGGGKKDDKKTADKNDKKSSSKDDKKEPAPKGLRELLDMGFSDEVARNALLHCNGNVEHATVMLLEHPDTCAQPPTRLADELGMDVTESPQGATAASPARKEARPVATDVERLLDPSKRPKTAAHQVTEGYGLLVMLGSYVRGRMNTLNEYCVICDLPHVFGNMLKPAVCSRELCSWSFQQLRVGAEGADDIATAAEVVDLLVTMAVLAANSPRANVIFEPFPTIMDPSNAKMPVLTAAKPDYEKLKRLLAKLPSVERMAQAKDFVDMKTTMDRADPHAWDLLQWIIASNRTHIVALPPDRRVSDMVTSHQFLMLSASPEKEATFRSLKAKHGSVFAFHGSGSENWHCIMRVGLRNASGTKLQVNGAAYGAGIYVSPHASTSFGYSRMHGGSGSASRSKEAARFLDTKDLHCIAIVEIVDTSEIKKSGSIWVVPNADHVVTRFFFVFTSAEPSTATNCACDNKAFSDKLRHALEWA